MLFCGRDAARGILAVYFFRFAGSVQKWVYAQPRESAAAKRPNANGAVDENRQARKARKSDPEGQAEKKGGEEKRHRKSGSTGK